MLATYTTDTLNYNSTRSCCCEGDDGVGAISVIR